MPVKQKWNQNYFCFYFTACFFHFLSGIGNAFCFLSCVVLVAHWFPPRRQALVIGLLVTMAFTGGMMAHTPFAYLNEHYGEEELDDVLAALLKVEKHFIK